MQIPLYFYSGIFISTLVRALLVEPDDLVWHARIGLRQSGTLDMSLSVKDHHQPGAGSKARPYRQSFGKWPAFFQEMQDRFMHQMCLQIMFRRRRRLYRAAAEKELDDDAESIITNERYIYIADVIKACYKKNCSYSYVV